MTITRTVALAVGGLLTLLAVVVVRAETARLSFQLAELDSRELGLRLQIRELELEAVRLRSPSAVRAKLAALHGAEGVDAPEAKPAGERGGVLPRRVRNETGGRGRSEARTGAAGRGGRAP